MTRGGSRLLLRNGESAPDELEESAVKPRRLEYRKKCDANVRISLPDFGRGVYHLPDRILDLLEIASYVFAADRMTSRGRRAALEYSSWSRSLHFVIKVRDIDFWSQEQVQGKLGNALSFAAEGKSYRFTCEGV